MSTVIIKNPADFQPSKSDSLYFTVSADTTNKPKFRYVYEVYVENYKVFEGKATPNPYGLGVIDISRVLDSYLQNYPVAYHDQTPIFTHQTSPFSRPYGNEVVDYYILVGEEYSDTFIEPLTGFTGIGNQVGFPSVPSNTYKAFLGTMGVNRNATKQTWDTGQFTMSGNPQPPFPYTETNLFLTNSPRIRDISVEEYYTLSFTNYQLGGQYLSEPYYAEYNFYDNNGFVIRTDKYANILSNGGGPASACTQDYLNDTFTGSSDFNILNIGVGPKNIYQFPSDTHYYTVQLFGGAQAIPPTPSITPTNTPTPSPTQGLTPTPTPSVTQTSTPSPSPFVCDYYQIQSNVGFSMVIGYTDCDGIFFDFFLGPFESYFVCARSIEFNPNISVINLGSCGGPSVTPSVTPTNTPSSTSLGDCTSGTTLNITDTGWLKYTDCSGTTQYVQATSLGTFTISACSYCDSIAPGIPFADLANWNVKVCGATCGTPSTTPTPTPSQSPAATQNVLIRDCCTGQLEFQVIVSSNLSIGNTIVIAGSCYQIYAIGGDGSGGNYTTAENYINCNECVANYPCPIDPNAPTQIKPSVQPTTILPSGGTAPCVTYSAVSEIFQFNVVPPCNQFFNEQIMFKNRYGVYDYFRFEKARAEGLSIDRQTYGQWNVAWGSDNPIKTNYSRGTTDFNTDIAETAVVNSGFISQPMMVWLEELYTTNDAYLVQTDGTLFPINIVGAEFVRKTKGNKSMVNMELTYTFSNNIKLLNN
jgi:hypothetical protein